MEYSILRRDYLFFGVGMQLAPIFPRLLKWRKELPGDDAC